MIEDAHQFVIFGATGNLATIKLLPSLYHLDLAGRLPADLKFHAFGRRDWSTNDWVKHMGDTLRERSKNRFEKKVFERFSARFVYFKGELNDAQSYARLATTLGKADGRHPANTIFYLAIKPTEFSMVINNLAESGFNKTTGKHRIVIEKPFGDDLESALLLNERLHHYFTEDQVYRIDHYLGKETVQNLLVLRLGNGLIESAWNRERIESVQITVAETLGIGSRAG